MKSVFVLVVPRRTYWEKKDFFCCCSRAPDLVASLICFSGWGCTYVCAYVYIRTNLGFDANPSLRRDPFGAFRLWFSSRLLSSLAPKICSWLGWVESGWEGRGGRGANSEGFSSQEPFQREGGGSGNKKFGTDWGALSWSIIDSDKVP